MDRQEGRVGSRALGPQRRQHDVLHRVVARQHFQQSRVEPAGLVIFASPRRIRNRSRRRRERRAAARYCARRSLDIRRTGREPGSAACRDGRRPAPCWEYCREPFATRRDRRKRPAGAWRSGLRSGSRKHGAPWWCARPRRKCRYGAGPRGHSRSRTGPVSGPCAPPCATSFFASSNGQALALTGEFGKLGRGFGHFFSGRYREMRVRPWPSLRAQRSNPPFDLPHAAMDCFAALAMTGVAAPQISLICCAALAKGQKKCCNLGQRGGGIWR